MADRAWDVDELEGVALPARLVPSFARAALAPVDARSTSPHREERAAVARAGGRRQAEFFSGRACAHAALRALAGEATGGEELGGADAAIGVGPGRQPLWPPGMVGSIAHGGSWCGALVARAGHARGLGLDIEPLRPLPSEVERLVLTGQELRLAPASGPLAGFAATFAFSAKECVYKALFPTTGWALDFQDVAVDVDLDRLVFGARLADRFFDQRPDLDELGGRFAVWDGHVFTVSCLA